MKYTLSVCKVFSISFFAEHLITCVTKRLSFLFYILVLFYWSKNRYKNFVHDFIECAVHFTSINLHASVLWDRVGSVNYLFWSPDPKDCIIIHASKKVTSWMVSFVAFDFHKLMWNYFRLWNETIWRKTKFISSSREIWAHDPSSHYSTVVLNLISGNFDGEERHKE